MLFGSLEILPVNGKFTFSFNGPNGRRDLGVGNDLKGFAEARLASGMMSPELAITLQQFREVGESHDWKWEAMCRK